MNIVLFVIIVENHWLEFLMLQDMKKYGVENVQLQMFL